jgi:DNA repair exonuclease SbcCD nuclease subunit
MPDFRFLHAADLHLDSPLLGLEADPSAPAELIRGATRRALGRLVDLAIAEKVDFLLVAGDIYDGDWPDFGTGLFFANQMRRLATENIPVFAIRGNHDAANRMTRSLRMPPNVTLFDHAKAHTIRLDAIGVAIHGQSFGDPAEPNDLSQGYPPPDRTLFNIGLLHTSAEGYAAHARYAPCDVSRLKTRGYDYWALGHVHERQTLSEDPWIVFPGNLQGRNVRETGPKGATLVSVTAGRATVDHRTLDVLRWAHIEVDLDGATDEADAMARIHSDLENAARAADPRPLAARVTLTGTTTAHAALSGEGLREKILNEASGRNHIWLEAVRLRTRPPREAVPRNEAMTRLLTEIDALAAAPPPDLLGDWPATLLSKLADALPGDHPLHDPATILGQARRRLAAALTGDA